MSINFVENHKTMSDEEIVCRINSGDFELFGIIRDRYISRILYYVNKLCPENAREDAVQEATYALYTAVKTFDSTKSSFFTFASICIKRSVINGVRQSNRNKNIPDELLFSLNDIEIADSNSPEKILIEREEYEALADSIRLELSGLEYEVLQLFLSGKKYSEIANQLGISEKSVNNALSRIRKKLK